METQNVATPSDATPEPSLDDRILGAFGLSQPEAPKAEPVAQPAQAEAPEVEEVEIPEDVTPQETFEWELKHNGEVKKLTSKDELTRLAQQGYDYDFKMQRVREDAGRIQSMAQAAQAKFAMQTQALDALAEAKSYERELKRYANVDWVQASQADPQAAFAARMAYDQLNAAHQAAMQKAQSFQQPIQQATAQIDAAQRELEMQKLTEKVPEWRDSSRFEADRKAILDTVQKAYGVTQEELSSPLVSQLLGSHKFVQILNDARKYREAKAASAKKGPPQGLPQVAKPGSPTLVKSKAQQLGDVKRALTQTKDKGQRKVLETEMIARKFGLKD